MNLIGFITYPLKVYRDMRDELQSLRRDNLVKLANLNARIESGEIHGTALDAVTECLEAQSVNLKKRETDKLKGRP